MLKKSLFVVAALAMLAVTAQAGVVKLHTWPTTFVAQELATIPVKMDVGYWIEMKDQDKKVIKLAQKTNTSYEGCTEITVENNFALTMTCSIAAVPGSNVGGDLSCNFGAGVNSVNLEPGSNKVNVCAYLNKASIKGAAPAKDVHVANVKLWVVPRT